MITILCKLLMHKQLNASLYKIRRRSVVDASTAANRTPIATLNPVSLALEYYQLTRVDGAVLQIGACDGGFGDPLQSFLLRGCVRGILVEPILGNFRRLKARYEGVDNVIAIQAAVSHRDGFVTMYRAHDEGRWAGDGWVGQVASFSREHLLNHGLRDDEIQEEQVCAMTVKSVLGSVGPRKIGFVQIDTEGFDADVVEMVLELECLPEFINFEHIHIPSGRMRDLLDQLSTRGYLWIQGEYDTLAVSEVVAERWRAA